MKKHDEHEEKSHAPHKEHAKVHHKEPAESPAAEVPDAEPEPPKSATDKLRELYGQPDGEFVAEYVAPDATKFHVVSASGVLVNPKNKKPLEFEEADAAEVAAFLGLARPNDAVRVRPIS